MGPRAVLETLSILAAGLAETFPLKSPEKLLGKCVSVLKVFAKALRCFELWGKEGVRDDMAT